jgi:broad specificity phosphatase PhoE
MSTLLLVRHGQARAFEADSDRLTSRGEEQAARVGEFLAQALESVDVVCSGTLTRQRGTAEFVKRAFEAAGKPLPPLDVDPGWNEYDADGILGQLMPELSQRSPRFAALTVEFREKAAEPDRNRYFQRMFEVLMDAWANGEVAHDAVESFAAFRERVVGALRRVTAPSRGGNQRVVVFTSGGPIGTCVQEILGAPAEAALRLNFRVKNASITEMTFGSNRISLDSFNGVEHLAPALRTFR